MSNCPKCETPVRAIDDRLICDACDGMLLSDDDYAASLRALDRSTTSIEVGARTASTATCPRCGKPMESAELSYGGIKLGAYLRCERDGIWVPNEGMIGAFAVVGQSSRRTGQPVLSPDQSIWPGMRNILGGAAGVGAGAHGGALAMKSVANAFANRAQFVSLGSVLPRTRTAFVSAFSGQDLTCPACAKPLSFEADRWACGSCSGSFVEDAALIAMVQNITQDYWELPPVGKDVGTRACPACQTKMSVEKFHSVEIDRCKGHGSWFDAQELQSALIESTDPAPSTGGWLRRLFGR